MRHLLAVLCMCIAFYDQHTTYALVHTHTTMIVSQHMFKSMLVYCKRVSVKRSKAHVTHICEY